MSDDLRIQSQSLWPHVAVVIVGGSLAVALILTVLWLRPAYDPLIVIGYVSTTVGIIATQAVAIIKSMQHDEQSRQIGQNVVGRVEVVAEKIAEVKPLAVVVPLRERREPAETPLPVKIVAEEPVPVKVEGNK